jgi:general secretion pathway protein A
LMAAFGRDRDTVTAEDIIAAIEELQWVEFAAHTNRMRILNLENTMPDADTGPTVGRILLASEGKTVMERELKPGRLVIGRTPDNDIQIDSKFISRHHCQIVTQADSCLIEDLNSTNGIFVQSKRVRRHNLNDGDVVKVGQHEIMYIDERQPRLRGAGDAVENENVR